MNTIPLPLSQQIHARLMERLQPTELRVIDESADHAGHVGAAPPPCV
jgi:BolA protein